MTTKKKVRTAKKPSVKKKIPVCALGGPNCVAHLPLRKALLALLVALALVGCGSAPAEALGSTAPSTAAPSPQCKHVQSYYAALDAGGCTPYLPTPDFTDAAACDQAATDLDACYADPTCWLAVQETNTCKRGLVPQWKASK